MKLQGRHVIPYLPCQGKFRVLCKSQGVKAYTIYNANKMLLNVFVLIILKFLNQLKHPLISQGANKIHGNEYFEQCPLDFTLCSVLWLGSLKLLTVLCTVLYCTVYCGWVVVYSQTKLLTVLDRLPALESSHRTFRP